MRASPASFSLVSFFYGGRSPPYFSFPFFPVLLAVAEVRQHLLRGFAQRSLHYFLSTFCPAALRAAVLVFFVLLSFFKKKVRSFYMRAKPASYYFFLPYRILFFFPSSGGRSPPLSHLFSFPSFRAEPASPFLFSLFLLFFSCRAEEEVEDGHSYGHSVCHLFEY